MRGYKIVLMVAATALAAVGATLAVTGYLHFGRPGHSGQSVIARSTASAPSPSHINASQAAEKLETNPTLAKVYAENAVGHCLQQAWGNAGYQNVFDQYVGHGMVEFRTGTPANPTGSFGEATLIDVLVYTDGKVAGMAGGGAGQAQQVSNAALDYWGCRPFKDHPRAPAAEASPAGLQADGALDVGCKLRGTPGYTSFQGEVTLYDPGNSGQSVSLIAINWGSNGILLSEQTYRGDWIVGPHQSLKEYVSAPGSATSCDFAGWNP